MDNGIVTVYFDGVWNINDGVWEFIGQKNCKAIMIDRQISFLELRKTIIDRFKVDTCLYDLAFTHANTTRQTMRPFDVTSDEDVETFFCINNLPSITWSVPLCVELVRTTDNEHTMGKNTDEMIQTDGERLLMIEPVPLSNITVGDLFEHEASVEEHENSPSDHVDGVDHTPTDDMTAVMNIECGRQSENSAQVIRKGQSFRTKDELKAAICMLAVTHCFDFRVKKSNTSVVVVVCFDESCKWRIRATKMRNSSLFFVSKFIDVHTCTFRTRREHQRGASYKLIAQRVRTMFDGDNKGPTPNQIMNVMRNEYNIHASYWKCWKAQKTSQNLIRGEPEDNFTNLPSYLYMLQQVNPGSVANIEIDVQNRFKYAFLAFGASISGYKFMRKVLSVDGSFLKGKFGGVLLAATAQDANMQIYPIAFAVVDSENDASWDYFFRSLTDIIPDTEDQVFISDRHASIKKAILKYYPQSKHGTCIYHLKQNIKTRCREGRIQNLFMEAAQSYTIVDFTRTYNEICQENMRIGAYLQEAGIKSWSRALFPGKRYNIMTNNNAECVNAVLGVAREYPIMALFDEIRSYLSKWFNTRRQNACQEKNLTPPDVQQKINSRYEKARKYLCNGLNMESMQFEVLGGERDVVVRLSERTCSCREFELDDIPCAHALAAAMKIKIDGEQLVGEYFTTASWFKSYQETIYPVPDKSEWTVPENIREAICNPPIKRKRSGRMKKARIPSIGEFKRKKCSCCGSNGHNKKTCSAKGSKS